MSATTVLPRTTVRRALITDLPVLLVALLWGYSYLTIKTLTVVETVVAALLLRFGIALLVLAATGWRKVRLMSSDQLRGTALLGAGTGVIFLLETYGLVLTSVTNAGLLIAFSLILMPLVESRLGRSPLPRPFRFAAAAAALGAVLLVTGGHFTTPNLGDLLLLVAALARTAHMALALRSTTVRGVDGAAFATVQTGGAVAVYAALAALPGTGRAPWTVLASADLRGWAGLVFLCGVCTLLGFAVQNWAARRTSHARVGLLLGSEPLWAVAVGIAVAGEHIAPLPLAGALLVVAGTGWGRFTAFRAWAAKP